MSTPVFKMLLGWRFIQWMVWTQKKEEEGLKETGRYGGGFDANMAIAKIVAKEAKRNLWDIPWQAVKDRRAWLKLREEAGLCTECEVSHTPEEHKAMMARYAMYWRMGMVGALLLALLYSALAYHFRWY